MTKLRGLTFVKYAETEPFFPDQKRTAAQKAGLRYEASVVKRLKALYKDVRAGPWILYKAANMSGICQPDALVWINSKLLVVVEVKLSRQQTARDKLLHFYGPLVERLHPNVDLAYLQIYKNVRKGAHKRTVPFYGLDETLRAGRYKECQILL